MNSYRWRKAVAGAAAMLCAACTDSPSITEQPRASLSVVLASDSLLLTVPDEQALVNAHVIDGDGIAQGQEPVIRWTSRDKAIVWIDEGTLGAPVRAQARANGATWLVSTAAGAEPDSMFIRVNVPVYTQKPVWRFTVAAGARSGIPLTQLEELAKKDVSQLNVLFNMPGAFAGQFEFTLDSVFTYPESAAASVSERMSAPRSAQYLILYDTRSSAGISGGAHFYYAPQTIHISKSDWMTSPQTALAVAHEMGHARGALDIYNYSLSPEQSAGAPYYRPETIMEGNGHRWDPLSQILINKNAGNYPGSPENTWLAPEFPDRVGVRVVDREGKPVSGAEVIFHKAKGDIWNNASPAISARGFTDAAGVYLPPYNPFDGEAERGPSGYWCAMYGCLYLVLKVEVRHAGHSTWAYMTAGDAVVGKSRTGPVWLRKIRLGAPTA